MNMSVTTDGVSMTIKTGSKDIAADVIAQLRTFEDVYKRQQKDHSGAEAEGYFQKCQHQIYLSLIHIFPRQFPAQFFLLRGGLGVTEDELARPKSPGCQCGILGMVQTPGQHVIPVLRVHGMKRGSRLSLIHI